MMRKRGRTGYKFRVEALRCFHHAAAILDWAENRSDQPISEADIQQVASKENWGDMVNFNMQLHGDLVSFMEECTEDFETVRNTKTEVGLDAWRRLNHKYHPRNPLRNIQLLEKLLAPTQVGYSGVIASMERLEQELRVVCQRVGNDVQELWQSIHMVCIQKIYPEILRDHLAVQASSITPLRNGLTLEKFLQATPMDVDALAETKGGKKGGKGKDKSNKPEKFDGNCFWCCAYGHMVQECRKKADLKPKTAQSAQPSDPKHNGKGKGVKGKKRASSLDEWPGDQSNQTPSEKSKEDAEVAGLFIGAVNRRAKCSRRDWLTWNRTQE